jgi:kynurenine formamidase
MRFKTLIVGYALALALLLFAQRHPDGAKPEFSRVLDLTHTLNASVPTYEPPAAKPAYQANSVATIEKSLFFARDLSFPEHFGTHLDAPAHFARGGWTVDQIPAERLLAPLAVIDVRNRVRTNPDYQLSMEDIAEWEKVHGQVPMGSVVIAYTGWESRWNSSKEYRNSDARGTMHFPGFSLEAVKFLMQGRAVVGFGIDTLSVDYGPSKNFEVHRYSLSKAAYHLENVANLDVAPESGAIVVVAPIKTEGGSGGPVRILALVR